VISGQGIRTSEGMRGEKKGKKIEKARKHKSSLPSPTSHAFLSPLNPSSLISWSSDLLPTDTPDVLIGFQKTVLKKQTFAMEYYRENSYFTF